MNVVIIGGGTGQSRVLKALKNDVGNLSAIVTMADDGGSTGRLRKYQNAPAVGDLRQCLVALAEPGRLWSKIFPYRFGNDRWGKNAKDIEGHVIGNILLVALVDVLGGLPPAVASAAREMGVKSTHGIYPSTFENVVLEAELNNGQSVVGQYNISHTLPRAKKFRIKKLTLKTVPPKGGPITGNPEAVSKINQADVVIIGPGALHGSVLPNLLIPEITKAIQACKAKKIYISNTAIKLAETHGFTLQDHVRAIIKHTSADIFDLILVNNKILKHQKAVSMLTTKMKEIEGIPVRQADLVDDHDIFNHDPRKLREQLLTIFGRKL